MQPIIGIDFGTTNSEVAVYKAGKARIIPGSEGERVIPSAVYLAEDGKHYVGQAARNVAVLHPQRVVLSVKRELGSSRRWWIDGREYGPEQIACLVFGGLKQAAEEHLGLEAEKAVVTVPAYFDDPRRQAVKRSAALAGLEVVRLVNEPTAAALAYGVDTEQQGTILVYDLGGGTFDVSVLQAAEGVFQVLATRGDTRLGGDDFDRKVAEVLVERFKEETGIDLRGDRLAQQKICQEAEALKMRLSQHKEAEAQVPFIAANQQGPCHLESRFSRREFEELIAGHLEKTVRLTRGALQDAGLRPEDIDRVLLVGGSTRIPAVRRAVEQLFGRKVEAGINPEEVVACGAAIEAGILAGQARSMALVDVTPLGLGVETADEKMVTLVPRNTALPVRSKALFTTVADGQKAAAIKVLQGQRARAEDNVLLGSFRLEGLQQARRGEPDIEVCFDIDVEGIVQVSAQDLDTGSSRSIELDGRGELSEEAVRGMVAEARAAELEDLYEERWEEQEREEN